MTARISPRDALRPTPKPRLYFVGVSMLGDAVIYSTSLPLELVISALSQSRWTDQILNVYATKLTRTEIETWLHV